MMANTDRVGYHVFLIPNDYNTDVNITWPADLPPDMNFRCADTGCPVRDIFAHRDLGPHRGGFTAKGLAPHDSAFIVVQQCAKEPSYPFQCVNSTGSRMLAAT